MPPKPAWTTSVPKIVVKPAMSFARTTAGCNAGTTLSPAKSVADPIAAPMRRPTPRDGVGKWNHVRAIDGASRARAPHIDRTVSPLARHYGMGDRIGRVPVGYVARASSRLRECTGASAHNGRDLSTESGRR